MDPRDDLRGRYLPGREAAMLGLFLLGTVFLSSCAESSEQDQSGTEHPGYGPPSVLTIENTSLHELGELRVHGRSDYQYAPNLLNQPIARNQTLVFCGSGSFYLTVFRRLITDGPMRAYTTGEPLNIKTGGRYYRLVVRDYAFWFNETEEAGNDRHTAEALCGDGTDPNAHQWLWVPPDAEQ